MKMYHLCQLLLLADAKTPLQEDNITLKVQEHTAVCFVHIAYYYKYEANRTYQSGHPVGSTALVAASEPVDS